MHRGALAIRRVDARIEDRPARTHFQLEVPLHVLGRDWTCYGLIAPVRRVTESNGASTVDTLLRIPFASLDRATPRDGEIWRANFFRIDRHTAHGDEFSAWQPTLKTPADFHVPAAFGALRFAV